MSKRTKRKIVSLYLFRQHEQIIYHVLRFAGKFLSQFRVLGGYTHGASIEMTFTHHCTAHCDQRSCAHTDFVSTQNGRNNHVKTCSVVIQLFQFYSKLIFKMKIYSYERKIECRKYKAKIQITATVFAGKKIRQ